MLRDIRNIFNGLAFGITLIVPGLSAATIAIILGFYDELLAAVNHFTADYRKNVRFLLPLTLGVIAGVVTLSTIINNLLTRYSFPTMLFFIGLLGGIVPHICMKAGISIRKPDPRKAALVAVPFLVLLVIAGLKTPEAVHPADAISNANVFFFVFLFAAGVVSAAALVIPGVSGSFVLLLMGVYPIIIYTLSSIRNLPSGLTNLTLLSDICVVLAPFGIGVVIGGLSMARLIEKLLRSYPEAVYCAILGLLLGSVYALARDPIVFQSGVSTITAIAGAASLLTGIAAAFLSGKKS